LRATKPLALYTFSLNKSERRIEKTADHIWVGSFVF
jgi:hypothetical protein